MTYINHLSAELRAATPPACRWGFVAGLLVAIAAGLVSL